MKKRTLIPIVLVVLLVATVNKFQLPAEQRSPASEFSQIHRLSTNAANARLLGWLERKSDSLNDWMSKRGKPDGPPDFIDFYIPKSRAQLTGPVGEEVQIAKRSKELFDEYFPPSDPSSFIGTFFESGNPYIQTQRGPYQWDSIKASEMSDPALFLEAVTTLKKAGIKSMRIGPNLFELDPANSKSWDPFIDKIEVMWRNGVTPTISVAFFPSLKRWEKKSADGKIDYENSYLLHPQFPKDMGRLTTGMMTELWKRASIVEKDLGHRVNLMVNPINEPETLAGFNRHFWHGAHANWGDPETMKFYVPSVIQIAKANVEIRLAVEALSNGRRILFAHNEAMTPVYYPSHQGGGRFAVSKFMLGDDVVLKADLDELERMNLTDLKVKVSEEGNELLWAMNKFIFGEWNKTAKDQEEARLFIVKEFQALKDLHLSLLTNTKKTMKTDNILLVDYYYQTEYILPQEVEKIMTDLSLNQGEKLRELLDVKTDEGFFEMLKKAATVNEADLPPQGPKGSLIPFNYKKLEDVNFKDLLSQNDFVVLERLVGLRREFQFNDQAPFETRQRRAGFKSLSSQLYRLDGFIDEAVKNNGKGLQDILGVKTHAEMWAMINAIKPVDQNDSLSAILNANGQEIFKTLLGIKREFLLGFEPQHYARQIRAGIRHGFHKFMIEYVNATRLFAAGVGESGTPFFTFSPLLHDQVMMEYASALKSGIYGTQYSFGPAVDTRGWAKAPLGLHYDDDHEINPSGLLKIDPATEDTKPALNIRPWPEKFITPLFKGLQN
jgi:hypothetical protein